jgi:hypothetical protein
MTEQNDEFRVEIEDDTPPEDRNKVPMPKDLVEEIEKDDLEEYSEKVQTRIKQMKKVFHDERRAKEAAAREREEALRFAQQAYEENKLLKQRLSTGEKIFAKETTNAATIEMNAAKAALKAAYELGDPERITEAQDALTDAKFKLREVSSFRPSLHDDESGVQQGQQNQFQNQSAPRPDPKAVAWKDKNTWFGKDEEMTALALGLHEKLVREGVDPTSDDYYARVDRTMKKRFPDYFGEVQDNDEAERPARKTNSTVVAPATRSTAPRQIRITASQAAIAKRLGISPEAYAREVLKLENTNG